MNIADRDAKICALRFENWSLSRIALKFGISKARVGEIFKRQLDNDRGLKSNWQWHLDRLAKEKLSVAKKKKKSTKHHFNSKFSTCLGCKKRFNATEMRSHKCVLKTWPKRLGWVYSASKKRYMKPEKVA